MPPAARARIDDLASGPHLDTLPLPNLADFGKAGGLAHARGHGADDLVIIAPGP